MKTHMVCTLMLVFHIIFFRMRNISDMSFRKNENPYFMLSNLSPKIVPFVR
jgi:hypothetical protein